MIQRASERPLFQYCSRKETHMKIGLRAGAQIVRAPLACSMNK